MKGYYVKRIASLASICFLLSMTASSMADTVTIANGGSIQTNLAYGITLNEKSSLQREWITVHNDLPVDIINTAGIKTAYQQERVSGNYVYKANYSLSLKEPVVAYEVRFLLFNIWGNHVKTLSDTDVIDLKAGETKTQDSSWNLYSENEASEYYASIAYVATVRLASGQVLKANPEPVLAEARKFSAKFQLADLEPTPKKDK